MPRVAVTILAVALAACGVAGGAEPAPPPVAFDGFGLGEMSAAASVARALRAAEARDASAPLDVVVRGPGAGRAEAAPLAAEVRSRVEGIDLAAGFQGEAMDLVERSPRWTGRIGVGNEGPAGRESLELRTRLESRAGVDRLGVEVGPRIERRLRRGARVFFDGAASAEACRGADAAGWQLPGTSTADIMTAVGVSARTGIIR